MLQFMGDNKRLLQFHEQKLSDLEAFKSDTHMFQKNASASLNKFRDTSRATGPEYAKSEQGYIP